MIINKNISNAHMVRDQSLSVRVKIDDNFLYCFKMAVLLLRVERMLNIAADSDENSSPMT
jgi:hypothetical protein